MASKVSQLTDLLTGASQLPNENPLTAYHAASKAINGNRKATTERRLEAIRDAVTNFRVMVSAQGSDIRIFRPDTRREFILVA